MPQVFECTACGFQTFGDDDESNNNMIIVHQAVCAKLEPEKREFRESIVRMMWSEERADAILEQARKAWG